MELVKIVKSKEPSPLYKSLNRSKRNENRFLTPEPSNNFAYKGPWLWNSFKKELDLRRFGLDSEESLIKSFLKKSLLHAQNIDTENWCNSNFVEFDPIEFKQP